MKTLYKIAAMTAFAIATPAQANTLIVIGSYPEKRSESPRPALTQAQVIELAAEQACEKPFIRDLKGQALYRDCLTEVRAEVRAQIAERNQADRQVAIN